MITPLSLSLLFLLYLLSLVAFCSSSRIFSHNSHLQGREAMFPKRDLLGEDSTPLPTFMDFLAQQPLGLCVIMSFVTGYILGTTCFLLWRLALKCCCARTDDAEEFGCKPTLFSTLIKGIEDLAFLEKLEAEGGDKPALETIGRGGCGEVYKAELLTGGRLVSIAIKKIVQPVATEAAQLCEEESELLNNKLRQIRSEIRTVGRVHHPNLLRLLAHVPRPDCHYLVYEFMRNGSLQDMLRRVADGTCYLSWPARHRIALGIAAGLEYLHAVNRPRIIHRDLKPANILLDDNLDARIADFGLAKMVPIDAFSDPLMSSNIAGTVGYIAPEYYQTLTCTDKCDIYSFGVIMAVLITGKFPNDRFFQTTDEMCITGWVNSVVGSENPVMAIDKTLLGNGFEEEILLVLKIACFCTYDDPSERPNSKDIRCMLSQIKHY